MNQQSVTREAELVAFLRTCAASLPTGAADVSHTLTRYASAIENPRSTEQALVEMHRFAHHYKGLRDLRVPGVEEQEWFATVAQARRLSSAALQARGLDKSLVSRFRVLLGGLRGS